MGKSFEKLDPEKAFEEGKAIQHMANTAAKKEGLAGPDKSHYEMISKMLDLIQELDPKIAEGIISISGESKDLSDAMGRDNFEKFNQISEEIMRPEVEAVKIRFFKKYFPGTELELDKEAFIKDANEAVDELVSVSVQKIYSDQRIKEVFAGRPDLLEQSKKLFKHQIISDLKKLLEAEL